MTLDILYFAWLRERIGTARERIDTKAATVAELVAEVIDIGQKTAKERRRREARAKRKAQAVASALSCGLCPKRCAHCGMTIEYYVPSPPEAPYPFCDVCLEEYRAFARRDKGDTIREAFWHTDQWADMWRSWLHYMKASDGFRKSAAFLKLMQEQEE